MLAGLSQDLPLFKIAGYDESLWWNTSLFLGIIDQCLLRVVPGRLSRGLAAYD